MQFGIFTDGDIAPDPVNGRTQTEAERVRNIAAGPPEVSHAPGASRYEVRVGGELAGLIAYVDRDRQRIFYHTEVDDEFGGRGLAEVLVAQALADSRDADRRIVPVCPYVARWVQNHHDVDDVLDPVTPGAFAAVRDLVGNGAR